MSSAEYHYYETRFEAAFPANGMADDLTDPITRRTLYPVWVRLELVQKEMPDEGVRKWAHVAVYGPRRLKSGELGQEISSFGWEQAYNRGSHPGTGVERPEQLTALLAEHLPDGWHPGLLEIPTGGGS